MRPPPAGWPRLSSALYYQDAAAAIDWLCRAFGFEVKLKVQDDDGRIRHSELTYGEALVIVGQEEPAGTAPRFGLRCVSPRTAGANTQGLMLYVDDADAHCEHARRAGATVVAEPATHDYGEGYWADRSYGAQDCEGHVWWFSQRVRG